MRFELRGDLRSFIPARGNYFDLFRVAAVLVVFRTVAGFVGFRAVGCVFAGVFRVAAGAFAVVFRVAVALVAVFRTAVVVLVVFRAVGCAFAAVFRAAGALVVVFRAVLGAVLVVLWVVFVIISSCFFVPAGGDYSAFRSSSLMRSLSRAITMICSSARRFTSLPTVR